ncbi:hypothetical protein SCOR_17645 [Sulfidibacter corallicola]|uniref:Uncharacterized protein n=1 Tax=Sulfidibacter corallicola TaxID=2818388 RepID=A0A8A4TWY9_SULCO|nr:hypothetical protein [Sulfidibacter corallicola]QTD53721.1 hypothetical protein J3U87_14810 [Sulfidibacter corallicola]
MSEDSVFRYLSLRPAKPKALPKMKPYADGVSDFFESLANAESDAARTTLADAFRASSDFIPGENALPAELQGLPAWFENARSLAADQLDLAVELESTLGVPAMDMVESEVFRQTRQNLADSLQAVSVLGEQALGDQLVYFLKLLHLVERVAQHAFFGDPDTSLGDALNTVTVENPEQWSMPEPPSPVVEDPAPDPPADDTEALRQDLDALERARREIMAQIATPDGLVLRAKETPPEPTPTSDDSLQNIEAKVNLLSEQLALMGEDQAFAEIRTGVSPDQRAAETRLSLSESARGALSTHTGEILARLGLSGAEEPHQIVHSIEAEQQILSGQFSVTPADRTLVDLGGAWLARESFHSTIGYAKPDVSKIRGAGFQASVGDLLVVKQRLKAYQLGDIAHVENVLRGEFREREHRRLEQREEQTLLETEQETERERDLQSTERNEIQKEAEEVVRDRFNLEAGMRVSASFGPAVNFSASLNASYATSHESSTRQASRFAREVTERAAERTRERVREERRRRVLHEIEETNLHRLDNTGQTNQNVRGVYRWLNKIYEARILNYGQRMMFEFLVPEPAAWFLHGLLEDPPVDRVLKEPIAPSHRGSKLKPEHLTRGNYGQFLAAYGVTDAPHPPDTYTVVSHFEKQDGTTAGNFGRAQKLVIPPDYEAYGGLVSTDYVMSGHGKKGFRIVLGGSTYDFTNAWGAEYHNFFRGYRKEIALALSIMNVTSFGLGVDVFCRLTPEGLAKWQHKVFASIMEAYLKQKADYDEEKEARQIAEGVRILGRNPGENRRLEQDELKKLTVSMLTGRTHPGFDVWSGKPPVPDLTLAGPVGDYVRFFENTFEWDNMLYVFYPYFWGRTASWTKALHLQDPDPDFAAFLKAGAARVQVPVRPGFEKAIAYFLQTGVTWNGGDAPLRDDDLYVPIVEEIMRRHGRGQKTEPYPDANAKPWDVVVPTSLVVVQDLEEVPAIKDSLTDKTMDIDNQSNG